MYNDLTQNKDEISKEIAMKKFLGFTEEDININNKRLEKETLFKAELKYKTGKIETTGNLYTEKSE